jgi:AraC-like DNA-binding protein
MPTDRERERDELLARMTTAWEDFKQAADALNEDHPDESLDKVIEMARAYEKEFARLCKWLNLTVHELKAERELDRAMERAMKRDRGT